MRVKISDVNIYISFPAVAFLTIALLSDRKGTFLICLVSSFLHELGHVFALNIKKVSIKSVNLNLGDVAINADYSHLSVNDEIIINLSGVAVNLLLSAVGFVFWFIFRTSFCFDIIISNLLITAFNLLPVRFLDGGQIILLTTQKFIPEHISNCIVNVLTVVFIIPVAVTGFLFLFNSSNNFSLLFVALYLICTLVSKEFKNVS